MNLSPGLTLFPYCPQSPAQVVAKLSPGLQGVYIEIWGASGTPVALQSSGCAEYGDTGSYYWSTVNLPAMSGTQEQYSWRMTGGEDSVCGAFVISREGNPVRGKLPSRASQIRIVVGGKPPFEPDPEATPLNGSFAIWGPSQPWVTSVTFSHEIPGSGLWQTETARYYHFEFSGPIQVLPFSSELQAECLNGTRDGFILTAHGEHPRERVFPPATPMDATPMDWAQTSPSGMMVGFYGVSPLYEMVDDPVPWAMVYDWRYIAYPTPSIVSGIAIPQTGIADRGEWYAPPSGLYYGSTPPPSDPVVPNDIEYAEFMDDQVYVYTKFPVRLRRDPEDMPPEGYDPNLVFFTMSGGEVLGAYYTNNVSVDAISGGWLQFFLMESPGGFESGRLSFGDEIGQTWWFESADNALHPFTHQIVFEPVEVYV